MRFNVSWGAFLQKLDIFLYNFVYFKVPHGYHLTIPYYFNASQCLSCTSK